MVSEVAILKRALAREKASRKAAEKILEDKSKELYNLSQKLSASLDEKSSELQGIFENIVDAYVVMRINGEVIKLNNEAVNLFGYDVNNEKLNVLDLLYWEDAAYAKNSFNELLENGYFKDYEARVITKDKNIKWVHINASLIKDKHNNPVAAQGIVRDITSQKEFAEQLVKSENRLSTLISSMDNGVLLEDENRNIILTNQKFCNLFSIPVNPDFLKGQDCSNAAEQSKGLFKDEEKFVKRIDEILKNKELVLGDELTMKNGTVLERDFIPIRLENTYRGHLWTYKDVTLNRTYRKSLEAQRLKYRNIIANMNLGLLEVDENDKILLANESFERMSGFSETELIGKTASSLFEADFNIVNRENKKRKNNQYNSYELKVKLKSGELKHWLISGGPNYDLKGNLIGSIGIHLDITDIKSLELQKEKLLEKLEKSNEELQEYAHIVSHDLKSPLRSINALVSWLKEDNKGILDETSLENFKLIETTLEKMEQLISDVLTYSSASEINNQHKLVDTQSLLEDLIKILYIPEHINISILKTLPKVNGDKTKLQQVFQNLISNAVKFCDKEQGEIKIDVVNHGDFYKFSVQDNGMGIESKFHDKIFKIFHALNRSKDSTGIGLSIVKKIVNLHEGNIWVESELGKGSTFYFTIKK